MFRDSTPVSAFPFLFLHLILFDSYLCTLKTTSNIRYSPKLPRFFGARVIWQSVRHCGAGAEHVNGGRLANCLFVLTLRKLDAITSSVRRLVRISAGCVREMELRAMWWRAASISLPGQVRCKNQPLPVESWHQ